MDATVKSHFIGADAPAPTKHKVFWRPTSSTGLLSWLTTVDHKRIGFLYGLSALFFFLVGGVEALLIRLQLAVPNNTLLTAHQYNEMFTMHGTTMIFLAIMPFLSALMNFIMPLQIGARDVAFPRLNAFSFWVFLAGAVLLNISWFMPSGPPADGWFGYAPLTSLAYTPDYSIDIWIFGIQLLGLASIAASLNFLVTIINLRAPGMTMMRVPVFTWMTLVTSFMIILAFPALTIAMVELMMDRYFGTGFFEVSHGGLPILWQHLFWIFGHPEVYIMIMPAFGVISEIIPVFSRKPLFGYPVVVFSGVAIAFLGFTVWAHHMFTTGMGTMATAAFSIATMTIAVPTGVKIFNWLGTIWGGQLRIRTPMLFALGFIWMFMIGGFSGVMHAAAPADAQQQDSYFVIAHFHYVLIGGSLFAVLAAIHYWMPLFSGRKVKEFWGKLSFWIIFIGFNVTFFPMHFLGLNGMPRRTFTYDSNMGWGTDNLICTIGAITLGIGIATYYSVMIYTFFKGERTEHDPWDARTIEWSLPLPVPAYNYTAIPNVRARDEWWYEKYDRPAAEREQARLSPPQAPAGGIHMPFSSIYPAVSAAGMFIGAIGAAIVPPGYKLLVTLIGGVIMFIGFYLWAHEGNEGYHLHPEDSTHS